MEWCRDLQTCPIRGLPWRAYAQYTFLGSCLEILITVRYGGVGRGQGIRVFNKNSGWSWGWDKHGIWMCSWAELSNLYLSGAHIRNTWGAYGRALFLMEGNSLRCSGPLRVGIIRILVLLNGLIVKIQSHNRDSIWCRRLPALPGSAFYAVWESGRFQGRI